MELPSAPVTENELEHFRREWKKQLDQTHPYAHQESTQESRATESCGSASATGSGQAQGQAVQSPPTQTSVQPQKPVKYTAKRPAPAPSSTVAASAHTHTPSLAPAAAPSSAKPAPATASPAKQKQKVKPTVPTTAASASPSSASAASTKQPKTRAKSPAPKIAAASLGSSTSSSSASVAPPAAIECTDTEIKAMDLYEEAMELEVSGRLADALQSYRAAFKLDPDVDVRFRTQFKLLQSQRAAAASSAASSNAHDQGGSGNATDSAEVIPFSTWLAQLKHAHSPLLPLHANRPQPISRLPDDLLLRVFQVAFASDTHAFFATSLVCKQFLVLAREATVWRYVCARHYPHRRQEIQDVPREDWMDFFRSEPRLRTDGAYISACRYIRPGFSESSMNAPILIVEYYRYLRFFRNGTVIAFMSPSEPRDVVKHLTPSASKLVHGEGYQSGRYLIQDDQVFLELHDRNRPLTTFNIQLEIRGNKRRVNRVARLEWKSYTMTTLTGKNMVPEEVELDLNEFKPYVFAKVKSYVK
ncbi:hypothetical protein BCR44DRAFT_37069 [Catenaria anguillulae PL171]|uniref:F-box domain-containing protein n=1 Tax=Catenaria anguillulae PL171 TaxID=765915 RepID=A0A1Y2HU26_9FUNG|nr:hypothetical protein BCR44DRAFT_37069 [Catenaria anguillulae PL171]